jgi:CheY-like chemotaxis protein
MSKKLILIVDDEEINLEMIGCTLEVDGYQVIKASNAKEAIELIEQNKLTLHAILMDLMMPGYDGFVTIKTIKGQRLTRLIPVMALTASNDRESVVKALESGADDYLTKPFDPEELKSRVRALCKISDFVKRWNAFAR